MDRLHTIYDSVDSIDYKLSALLHVIGTCKAPLENSQAPFDINQLGDEDADQEDNRMNEVPITKPYQRNGKLISLK